MIQLCLLILVAAGMGFAVNYISDDTMDARTLLYGRLGALAFAVGVVGLITIAVRSC